MTRFMQKTPQERWDEMSITRPIPGESLTVQPGKYPYERPAEFSDPEQALDYFIERFLEPSMFNATLAVLDAGAPLDVFLNVILQQAFNEGLLDIRAIPIVAIPLTVMLIRMCESAKVDFRLANDSSVKPTITEAEILARLVKEQRKAANAKPKAEKAMKDVKRMLGREGLMSRPEAFV